VELEPRLQDVGDEIHSRDRGWRVIERLLAEGVPFDGVYADDDLLAAGAIGALTAHGRGVPDDVSVVGFGGLAEARSSRPSITTVDVDFFQQGWLAGTILNKIVRTGDQAPPAAQILLETRLTVRDSSVPSGGSEQEGGAGMPGVL
jgi:LacI family transcriptional regulator, galactose operon repressor